MLLEHCGVDPKDDSCKIEPIITELRISKQLSV